MEFPHRIKVIEDKPVAESSEVAELKFGTAEGIFEGAAEVFGITPMIFVPSPGKIGTAPVVFGSASMNFATAAMKSGIGPMKVETTPEKIGSAARNFRTGSMGFGVASGGRG